LLRDTVHFSCPSGVFFGLEGRLTMRTLVTDTLAAWRQAERVLAKSQEGSADYDVARMAAMELRDLYHRLVAQTGLDPADEPLAEKASASDRDILKRVRADMDTLDP
jgi:hypothetical protein